MLKLDRGIPFVHAVLDRAEPDHAAALLHNIEQRHGLELRPVGGAPLPEGSHDDAWVASVLRPFVTETHLIISGSDLQDRFEMVDRAGFEQAFTWREWGEYLADWANDSRIIRPTGLGKTQWAQKQRRWEYFDFYDPSSLDYLVEGYYEWLEALVRVVRRRAELYHTPYNG